MKEMKEVKLSLLVPERWERMIREFLVKEKEAREVNSRDKELEFIDEPRYAEYAEWPHLPERKKIKVCFKEDGAADVKIRFLPARGISCNWFKFSSNSGEFVVYYKKEDLCAVRTMVNTVIGNIVRWKEERDKMGMLPWGFKKGQTIEGICLGFLSDFTPLTKRDVEEVKKKVAKKRKLRAVTALCLHADQERKRIVYFLKEKKIREVQKMISRLPLERLVVVTFHPDDIPVLERFGIEKVILPSIYRAEDREEQLKRQWRLSKEVFENLPFPVDFLKISDILDREVMEEAERRAEGMIIEIQKDPPPVFRFLSTNEMKRRIKGEAALCLSLTQMSCDFYLGLEVHSKYWKTGNLYKWGERYLPTFWLPSSLRQHWGW